MRPQEVCNLRMADIDTSRETWLFRPQGHKTAYLGRARIIPLNVLAQGLLKPYLNRPADCYLFSPREAQELHRAERTAKRVTPLSCGNRVGTNVTKRPRKQPQGRYTSQSYGRAIAVACRKAYPAPAELTKEQLKKWHRDHRWRPNQLRHLAATEIRAESGLEDASNYLGHADAQITLVYAERDVKRLIQTAQKRIISWNAEQSDE